MDVQTETDNPLKLLEQFGQSPWLDFIERKFLQDGSLQTLIDRDGLKGVTSNPSIFASMKLGVIGLGRMGGNISLRLMKHGHECAVYDNSETAVGGIIGQGAAKSSGLQDLVSQLPPPRSSGSCCHLARSPRAAELIEKQGLNVWVYAGDDWLLRDMDAPHREREEHTVKFLPKVVREFTGEHFNSAVKIVGVSDDLDKVAETEKTVQPALGKTVSAARSQPYYLDVTNPNANKSAVVDYLSRTLGIDAGEIATIGDMPK